MRQADACGSRSRRTVGWSAKANATARLKAVVVLPDPPFCMRIAMVFNDLPFAIVIYRYQAIALEDDSSKVIRRQGAPEVRKSTSPSLSHDLQNSGSCAITYSAATSATVAPGVSSGGCRTSVAGCGGWLPTLPPRHHRRRRYASETASPSTPHHLQISSSVVILRPSS